MACPLLFMFENMVKKNIVRKKNCITFLHSKAHWDHYYRWFHDLNLQSIRFDGGIEYQGDSVWMQTIIDLKTQHYYSTFFHDWVTAECFEG